MSASVIFTFVFLTLGRMFGTYLGAPYLSKECMKLKETVGFIGTESYM